MRVSPSSQQGGGQLDDLEVKGEFVVTMDLSTGCSPRGQWS